MIGTYVHNRVWSLTLYGCSCGMNEYCQIKTDDVHHHKGMNLQIMSQTLQHIQPYKDNLRQWTRIGCRNWASPENKYSCSQQRFPHTSTHFAWAVENSPKLFLHSNHWQLQPQRVSWYSPPPLFLFFENKSINCKVLIFFPRLICFFSFLFRISPAFSLFFILEIVILFVSAFLCPPFLLFSPQRPMVKSQSSRFFTWMSQIAHNFFSVFHIYLWALIICLWQHFEHTISSWWSQIFGDCFCSHALPGLFFFIWFLFVITETRRSVFLTTQTASTNCRG